MPIIYKIRKVTLLLPLLIIGQTGLSQITGFDFRHLTTLSGLSSPAVRSITQDRFGYIWIAANNGLNRYDSYDIKVFPFRYIDSASPAEEGIRTLFTDTRGTLWVALAKGLYTYNYNTGRFIPVPGAGNLLVTKMLQCDQDRIYLNTSLGLKILNTLTGGLSSLPTTPSADAALTGRRLDDFCIGRNGNLYLATDSGLAIYDTTTRRLTIKTVSLLHGRAINRLAIDGHRQLWLITGQHGSLLIKIDSGFTRETLYTDFTQQNNLADNGINSLFTDRDGRLWMTTGRSGLARYNQSTGHFETYAHDPLQTNSLGANLTNAIYQDRQGYIWVGSETAGLDYFDPDNNFFRYIQPSYNQQSTLPDFWCRAADQDRQGNLWLGTASGLSRYDPIHNSYTLFQHTTRARDLLPMNSVRSVLCDDNQVWVGTANGLNLYNTLTGQMKVLGEKDSLPASFFWSILKDHDSNIWLGCRNGIFKYDPHSRTITSLLSHPQLAAYAQNNTTIIFEDSRHRIWFGFYSKGLLMYDPARSLTRHWMKENSSHALSNNHITSIAEDKKNNIWIGTLDGLNAYHDDDSAFSNYLFGGNGIPQVSAALLVDEENRIWFAVNKGLCMLDANRQLFTNFDRSDGLTTMDFNTQSARKMDDGDFLYPTLKGFLAFNPLHFTPRNGTIAVYVSSVKVFEKELIRASNLDRVDSISLSPEENFFSLEMTAINYVNRGQNWYAYKLDNFDKDWIYTKDRRVNYTNVPGGDYVFHYKTSTDRGKWEDAPEKTLTIHIGTRYYRTVWFFLLSALTLLAAGYKILTYRAKQRERLLELQKKTFSLQKEKALAMYENLKQQLNPHFLFNSMTSLSSLITTNPTLAKEFLDRMSRIYRYILKSRDSETVSIKDEITLTKDYIQLQKTRFKEGLLLKIDLPEDCMHNRIAPVTIQNLVENAIKHNIIDADTPLLIEIYIEEDWIVVRNNLQKKKYVETSNRQGLANMRSLYNYLSGRPILLLEDNLFFTVKIPLL